jgi:vancomycin permeability regulator SanA
MAVRRKKKSSKTLITLLIIINFLDLFFLYYAKYNNHQLSLSEFSFSIGNFLNLFFTALLTAGLIIAAYRETRVTAAAVYIFLMTFFLISTVLVKIIDIPLPEYYMLNHPFPDILLVSLYCLFQLSQFIAISIIWSKLRDRDNLLHLKAAANSLLLIILLMVFSYLFSTKDVDSPVTRSEIQSVGVVLGAAVWSKDKPSPTLVSRLDKAVELYNRGYLQKVQLTGAHAPGELSEAEVAFKYIMDRGVVPEDIYYEDKTTSTSEQIKFIKDKLLSRQDLLNVIIISDNYHLPRVSEITKFYNLNTNLAGSKLNLNEKDSFYYNLRESIGLVIFWLFAL